MCLTNRSSIPYLIDTLSALTIIHNTLFHSFAATLPDHAPEHSVLFHHLLQLLHQPPVIFQDLFPVYPSFVGHHHLVDILFEGDDLLLGAMPTAFVLGVDFLLADEDALLQVVVLVSDVLGGSLVDNLLSDPQQVVVHNG